MTRVYTFPSSIQLSSLSTIPRTATLSVKSVSNSYSIPTSAKLPDERLFCTRIAASETVLPIRRNIPAVRSLSRILDDIIFSHAVSIIPPRISLRFTSSSERQAFILSSLLSAPSSTAKQKSFITRCA